MMIKLSEKKILRNESQWPKTYTRKFLEQGLVDYSDMKLGILHLPKDTIDQMIPSFIDKPVIIKHQEVTPGNFTDLAVGYIKDVYFNALDGWYYVDFLITHDEGHAKMDNGWGVSCAYKVNQITEGGKYHNIDYNGKIAAGVGEHLALVENPRYEDCLTIINGTEAYLYNEKTFESRTKPKQEDTTMKFNFLGKKEDKGFNSDTVVDLGNGKKAKLGEIVAFMNAAPVAEKHEIGGETEIELTNGTKVKLEDAVKAFIQNKGTDEGESEDEKKAKEVEEGKKAENAKKFKNCACGGKDDKHADNCKMYNADGSDKEKKDDKDEKMENAVKETERLRIENEALKAAAKHSGTFVKINNGAGKESDVVLENSTPNSGTVESRLSNSRKFFEVKKV